MSLHIQAKLASLLENDVTTQFSSVQKFTS